jgi:hypothetical protein
MTPRLIVTCALLAGCGKQRGTDAETCATAAAKGVDALIVLARERAATAGLPDEIRRATEDRTERFERTAPRLKAVITTRCVDDKWSAEVVRCHAAIGTPDDQRACRAQLTADQQARLQRDELDLMADTLGPPSFGGSVPRGPFRLDGTPEESELRRLEADLLAALERRNQVLARQQAAASDEERAAAKAEFDTMTLEIDELQRKVEAVKSGMPGP